jgi:mono/diheme cytochrome c family protein
MRSTIGLLAATLLALPVTVHAGEPLAVQVQIGPVRGVPSSTSTVSFAQASRQQLRTFDAQDKQEHNVRGVSLRSLLALARAPKSADTALIVYADGMQIPVRLADKAAVDALFIALEHGDAMDRFTTRYPLRGFSMELACPKVVYTRKETGPYNIWRYPLELAAIRLVTWKAYEAELAQPTRSLPDRSGWPLFMQHCQPCHGIGGQGAKRGPDFLTNMDAYRRVPPHASTGWDEHPSLHEKIKGFEDGTMPVLSHISNAEITTLWRWLHAVHRGSTR